MPKVSVIIASYDHEKFVGKAIQSVLDQTYQDFEIIITDDSSTDNTVGEIKKFDDSRIKLFCFKKNQGACVAAGKCIEEAKGEYISVLNSDDVFLPHKLQRQVLFLDEHPEIGALFGYAHFIDDEGHPYIDKGHSYLTIFCKENRSRFEWLNYFFYYGNCLCHPTALIRRQCYEKVGPYDKRLAQLPDLDFWIRLCMNYEIFILPESLIKFRILRNNINMSGKRPDSILRYSWEYRHILSNYLNIKTSEMFYKVFPEAEEYAKDIDGDLVPFLLALLALNKKSEKHIGQMFGLDILFNLLSERQTADKLARKFGFTYIDFIKMTGTYDIFNNLRVRELQSKLKNGRRKMLFRRLKAFLLRQGNA